MQFFVSNPVGQLLNGAFTLKYLIAMASSQCTVAQLLALLALPPHSKKVMSSIPAWGAVGSGRQVLPRVHSLSV